MEQAETLLKAGKLDEALDAQLAAVKKAPTNNNARFFLAELAAFRGDWDRVDRQLDAILVQNQNTALLPLLFRQLVRAEILREQVFNEGRPPEIVVPLPEDCQLQLKMCTAFRLEQYQECVELLEQAESAREASQGTCDGKSFDVIIDLDDRLRGVAEVMTATGKYFWLPWSHVASLRFSKPERPMDLIWRKAEISVRNGIDGEVYLPARYPNVDRWTAEEQLGRTTNWQDHPFGIMTGRGQRSLLVGDESVPFMEIGEITLQE